MVTFEDIRSNETVLAYIEQADNTLHALGYTEHSLPHLGRCASGVKWLLNELDYDERTIELAQIAAFMHDIGNMVNRNDHAHSGALIALSALSSIGMPASDVAAIATAIGHHDERTAAPIDAITCALIIADKCDVRRSRVRHYEEGSPDIHDRVNYAVKKADVILSSDEKTLSLVLTIDTKISTVGEYFEIFLGRMLLCKDATKFFGLVFKLVINDTEII